MNKRTNLQFAICNLQFAIFLLMFLSPSIALAHSMEVFATVEGKTIQGKASFHDGTPARNADVKAFDAAGEEIGRTKTDDQGKFSLPARFHCDYRLLVDTGDGHGAEYTILAKTLPDDLPPHGPATTSADSTHTHAESELDHSHDLALLKEIHADVDALQDQLDQYEHRIRFRDILGGIGFIVGLAGAAYGYYYRGLLRNKMQSRQ
jgi:nickel transport protein